MKNKFGKLNLIFFIFTVFVIIVLPFLVNESFKGGKGYDVLWGAADMLEYCVTALSVIVTAILSCIAVMISKKANDVSDRMLKLEEEKMTPYLDILREESKIMECRGDDSKLKIKLYIRNIGEYPIENIYLSKTELNLEQLDSLYNKDEIQNTIFEQFRKIDSKEKGNVDYNLTCIAGLREIVKVHSKRTTRGMEQEEERMPFSEWLYFNIEKNEVDTPIELFITMQNIAGKVFLQKTKLFIVQRNQGNDYFLTMHSKRIETISFDKLTDK